MLYLNSTGWVGQQGNFRWTLGFFRIRQLMQILKGVAEYTYCDEQINIMH